MKGKGVNAASQWLGRFAKLGVNPAESAVVKEDTSAICSVGKSPAGTTEPTAHLFDDGLALNNPIKSGPALIDNPITLDIGDLDQVLLATTATVVTIPILQHRQI